MPAVTYIHVYRIGQKFLGSRRAPRFADRGSAQSCRTQWCDTLHTRHNSLKPLPLDASHLTECPPCALGRRCCPSACAAARPHAADDRPVTVVITMHEDGHRNGDTARTLGVNKATVRIVRSRSYGTVSPLSASLLQSAAQHRRVDQRPHRRRRTQADSHSPRSGRRTPSASSSHRAPSTVECMRWDCSYGSHVRRGTQQAVRTTGGTPSSKETCTVGSDGWRDGVSQPRHRHSSTYRRTDPT